MEYNPLIHNIYVGSSQDGEIESIKIIAPDKLELESSQNLQLQKV